MSQERQQHTQVSHTIRKQVNFNTAGIGDTQGILFGELPQGAFIMSLLVEIVTAFNAATTNVLTLGANATANNMMTAADSDELAASVTSVTRPLGRGLTAAGPTKVYVKYTQSGTAATAGQAEIVMTYEGNLG